MYLIKWTAICSLLLLLLVSLIDQTLGKLTLYLSIALFVISFTYLRSLLADTLLYTKFRLSENYFTKSSSQPIDWSKYLPQLPSYLVQESTHTSIDTELATLADKLTENYVSSWFKYIGDDPRFVHDVRHIIHAALYKLITVYLPSINVNIFLTDIIRVIDNHMREVDAGQFDSPEAREALLSRVAQWILTNLGPKELINLKSIKCSREQKRDASYHLIKRILSNGALASIVDTISQPNLIITNIMKLVDDTYSRKEEIKRRFLETEQPEDVESSDPVIPKILISNATLCKDASIRHDTEEEASSRQPSTRSDTNSSILNKLTEKLRLPLSIEQALSLNRSRGYVDQVTGIEKGVEVTEHSSDLKLISNVRIGDAKETTSKGDNYIIYKIVYDGLFEEIETNVNTYKPTSSSIVRKEVIVWHRFSSFVDLHEQLSADRKMKLHLKNIRSPSKLKTVFESKLEKSITQTRCKFLTEYLNKLSNIPVICNSRSFRTFMAYGQDCDEGSNRYATEASTSQFGARFERIVSGGFKNVVSAMKRVLPSEPYQEGLLASFLLPPLSRRIVVQTVIGDFTDFDDRLRSIQSTDSYCLLFPLKDDTSTSYDVTPSPSPLSASVASRSSYFSHQSSKNTCNSNPKYIASSDDKLSEVVIDLMEILLTQTNDCSWWAVTLKVVLTDVLES